MSASCPPLVDVNPGDDHLPALTECGAFTRPTADNIECLDDDDLLDYFTTACKTGDIELILLLSSYPGLANKTVSGRYSYALRQACYHGYEQVVRKLLEKITIEVIRRHENAALRLASRRGHVAVVKLLLGAGLTVADVRSKNNYALTQAWSRGHEAVARQLLGIVTAREDVNDEKNYTLKSTSLHGHTKIVRLMLEAGSTIEDERSNANAALQAACERSYVDSFRPLLSTGPTAENVRSGGDAAI